MDGLFERFKFLDIPPDPTVPVRPKPRVERSESTGLPMKPIYPAPPVDPEEEARCKCTQCGNGIYDNWSRTGNSYTADLIVEYTVGYYGEPWCLDCADDLFYSIDTEDDDANEDP